MPQPPPLTAMPSPPAEEPYFTQQGIASFYGKAHQGKRTAAGERFNRTDLTAAHRTLAFGTVVRVTNLRNGMVVRVRINDRGPHVKGRVIDLSSGAALALGIRDGLARVRIDAFRSDQPGGDFPP
jgi:rare lipoprotein A